MAARVPSTFADWLQRVLGLLRRTPGTPEPAPIEPASTHDERRRHPRVRVMSSLRGYGVELDLEVTVREASLGGFSVQSPIAFVVGSEHTFLFSTADGRESLVRCRCRHSNTVKIGGAATCVAGFEFVPQPAENLQIVIETINRLAMKSGSD